MKTKTLIAAGLGLLATLAAATPALAQQGFNGVRILVAADDADPQSVIRSSDIYHRIQLPLNDEMKRYDYVTLFADAIAAELRWEIQDRSTKQKSIDLAKTACTAGKSTLCPRVLILVKTRATAIDLGFGTKAEVRMTGEMIDVNTNVYIGGWEAPTLDFPAPKSCNNVCIENVVGDNARKVALNLGDTLRKMLDQQALRPKAGTAAGAVTGRAPMTSGGLVNNYVLTFERFQMQEVLPIKAIVENEFPETLDISMPEGGAGSFTFNFSSRAKADKVLELLHVMMEDRGYNLKNIKITTSGSKFIIDRIVDDGYRPKRPGGLYR
jgi:hypothetical protein